MEKYFISYGWSNTLGTQHGFGNTYMESPLTLTQADIEEVQRELQAKYPGTSIVILNVVELAG